MFKYFHNCPLLSLVTLKTKKKEENQNFLLILPRLKKKKDLICQMNSVPIPLPGLGLIRSHSTLNRIQKIRMEIILLIHSVSIY